jgi:hypothetical protein
MFPIQDPYIPARHKRLVFELAAGAVAASNARFDFVELCFPLSEGSSYLGCLLFDDEVFCWLRVRSAELASFV